MPGQPQNQVPGVWRLFCWWIGLAAVARPGWWLANADPVQGQTRFGTWLPIPHGQPVAKH